MVAADSRSTVLGQTFDGVEKLQIATTEHPVLVTITGNAVFMNSPPLGVSLKEWIPKATYRYQGAAFVQNYIEERPKFSLSLTSASEVANAFATSLDEFLSQTPTLGRQFASQEICRLVLCQVSTEGVMLVAAVALSVDGRGHVGAKPTEFWRFGLADEKALIYIGEDRYTSEHVLGPTGKRLLDQRAVDKWNSKSLVKEFRSAEAASFAQAIIQAAEATTKIVPVPSGNGIGGPVFIYLVTRASISPVSVP